MTKTGEQNMVNQNTYIYILRSKVKTTIKNMNIINLVCKTRYVLSRILMAAQPICSMFFVLTASTFSKIERGFVLLIFNSEWTFSKAHGFSHKLLPALDGGGGG